MKIAGKILVVTGAGSGMGREVVFEALRRGAKVAACDINPETLAETARLAAAGDRLSLHPLNVVERDGVEALPDAVIAYHGAVVAVVHCAGVIQPLVRLKDLEYETIDRVMAVNWLGTLFLTKTFLPILLGRPEGHIVNGRAASPRPTRRPASSWTAWRPMRSASWSGRTRASWIGSIASTLVARLASSRSR